MPDANKKLLLKDKEAGMTLIEVLIALFVFSIASLAIAAMTFMSIQGNSMANRMSQSTFLAQDKMEELLSFRDVATLQAALALSPESVDGNGAAGGTYTRTWLSTGNGPTAASRWLTVTVTWEDAKGNHQVVVRSLWRGI